MRQQRNLQKTDSAGHSEQQIVLDQDQDVEEWSVVKQQKVVGVP